MCYNVFKINLFKYRRFKDGKCTNKNTGSSPENLARKFRQHLTNSMKLNKIDDVEQKHSSHFLSNVFGLLSFRNVATMAT